MKPHQGGGYGLKIRVSGLSPGTHEYSFRVSPSDLPLDDNFDAPVEVKVLLEKTPSQIIVRGAIAASGTFPCDRCLGSFRQALSCRYAVVYIQNEEEAGRFPPEDVRVLNPDATVIDLAADVREMIMISVPLKLLCGEACRGLCSSCGADLNVAVCGCRNENANRPWQGLEKLLKH
ncbi:MAG TPA: DUF177 domain-containing protein [Bacteroidota bacterium]|nr:DUF177 domain-containing protein [Bacteroidota bacterium]